MFGWRDEWSDQRMDGQTDQTSPWFLRLSGQNFSFFVSRSERFCQFAQRHNNKLFPFCSSCLKQSRTRTSPILPHRLGGSFAVNLLNHHELALYFNPVVVSVLLFGLGSGVFILDPSLRAESTIRR